MTGHTHGDIIGYLAVALFFIAVFAVLLLFHGNYMDGRVETLEEIILTPTPVAERAR